MISVLKNHDKIVVNCSNSEYITIQKVKEIVKTIKKIDRSNNSPSKIIITSFKDIRFTLQGERFYNRIVKSKMAVNSRISLNHSI